MTAINRPLVQTFYWMQDTSNGQWFWITPQQFAAWNRRAQEARDE